ncbi:hypothetical protein JCM15519_29590 [Fundidesulfovibrio butyratiphilus]
MIAWWSNCRLSAKLAVCGAGFLVPIVLLVALLTWQMLRDIDLTTTEIQGMEVMAPLEDFNELLPDHLRLALARLAGENVDHELERTAQAMHATLAALSQSATSHSRVLGLDPTTLASSGKDQIDLKDIIKSLSALTDSKPTSAIQAMSDHDQAQTQVNRLRDYLGDAAQLVLDPELSSYYLLYLMVNDLPRALERLGRLSSSGYLHYSGLSGYDARHLSLSQYATLWEQSVVGRIQNKTDKVLRDLDPQHQAQFSKALIEFVDAANLFFSAAQAMPDKFDPKALARFQATGSAANKAGGVLWDTCNALAKDLLEARANQLKWRMGVTLGVCLASVLAAMFLAWAVASSITNPLARLASIAGRMADGKVVEADSLLASLCPRQAASASELARQRASGSEIVRLYSAVAGMIEGLSELLRETNASGGRIQGSAERIAASARQLEAAAAQQAASTTEVGATSMEISKTAQALAGGMADVLDSASRSAELAQEGRAGLGEMELAMAELGQASRDMTAKLSVIREKTSGIGQFLSTIAKVANQTNLLSLNAAIEAEKAGEFGLGFSVVAREIRRLADQTAAAALDIERTIREMQASVADGVQAMDGFSAKTAQASDTSRSVGQKLARIIASGEELTPRLSKASQDMSAQAEGADQISDVISHLADAAGQTRDALADFRLAAEDLNDTAKALRQALSHFELRD